MKILIPILSLSPDGGNRILIEIANHLVKNNFKVSIITSNYIKKSIYSIDKDVELIKIKSKFGKYGCYFKVVSSIKRYADEGSVPILNHGITFARLLVPKNILDKSVVLIQGLDWIGLFPPFNYILKKLCLDTLRTHNKIIPANQYIKNYLNELNINTLECLRLGIKNVFINKNLPSHEKNIDILFIGRPQSNKRLSFYLDTFEKVYKSNYKINIACISNDKKIEKIISKIKYINLIKPKNDFQIKSAYQKSKFFVLASLSEGFSLPPLEAMGSGCIPVIIDCGGPSAYCIDGFNGFMLSKNTTPLDLSRVLLSLIMKETTSFNKMRINCLNTASNWKFDTKYNSNLIEIVLKDI